MTNHKWGFTWIYPYVRNQYHSSRGDFHPEGASWRLMIFNIKIKKYMDILNHPRWWVWMNNFATSLIGCRNHKHEKVFLFCRKNNC